MREISIDCSGMECSQSLHNALRDALSFPEWYGSNLDALHDCLTSISVETVLTLIHFSDLGSFTNGFRRVLTDSAQENSKLHIGLL